MRKLGITSDAMADAVGVSNSLVRAWRAGRVPAERHIPSLAKALRTTQKKARQLVGL